MLRTALAIAVAAPIAAAATLPTDFDTPASQLNRLYSYFGGVSGFSVALSDQLVYAGPSSQLTINFQPSGFTANGVGVGSLGLSAPNWQANPAADTFSLTVASPPAATLACYITIREDDNADGVINIAEGDDEWESPEFNLASGTNVYNITAASFALSGEGSGNLIRNFHNTPRLAFIINFETRSTLPGGLITSPVTLYLDHVGFFSGPQSIPPVRRPGDANGDILVNGADLSVLLATFNQPVTPDTGADFNSDGQVNGADLSILLANFGL